MALIVSDGSRTVPIGAVKIQVNDSVDLEGHNTNRFPKIAAPPIALR
jgi:hypothetical protein